MLTGKTAIITGSNRGIGLATVELFAEHGATVWACARTPSEQFENKLREIAEKTGAIIQPVYFDVTDENAVKDAVRRIGRESARMDVLVNNAGISVESLFHMTSLDTMEQVMNTNFLSQVRLSQLVSRYMMKTRSGSIINVASVSGMAGETGGMPYGSSKAAVIFATKTMAKELGPYGVRVNSISPGFIATDMWEGRKQELKDKLVQKTPLGRQGEPAEVANAILFLASSMSSYITGHNLVVDGGRLGGN